MRFTPILLGLLIGARALVAAPLDESTQKAQLDSLFKAVLPVAETMVASQGAFHPFGASLSPDGKLGNVTATPSGEHPKSAELIAQLKASFRGAAGSEKIMACALAYDIRVVPPGQTAKTDAIAVNLDHRDGVSLTIICPYRLNGDKQPVFEPMLMQDGTREIFPAKKSR